MTTIYLIRHGQTDWNKEGRFRGRADVPLNDYGHREAEALAKHLATVGANACYSSPLSRARETAEIIARPHSLEVSPDDGIIDVDYGEWQGVPEDEARKQHAEIYQRWRERPHHTKFPNGESLAMVRKRALASLETIRADNSDGVALVVAHKAVTKVLMCAVLGLGNAAFWRIRQDNCAYNVIELSPDGAVVVAINNTCQRRVAADGGCSASLF